MERLLKMRDVRYVSLGLAFFIVVADQLSKLWLVDYMAQRNWQPEKVTSYFDLVMVWNTGVSFGLFAGDSSDFQRWALIIVSIVISVVMAYWLSLKPRMLVALGIGLVIGGAIGNIVDRFRWGAVADFFSFHVGEYYWPAFNIADSAIVLGVVILCWDSMVGEKTSPTSGTKV